MVDYATYKMLHHGKDAFDPQKHREPGLREFSADEASQGDEVYLFPPKVNGYSLVRKSWGKLSDILWLAHCTERWIAHMFRS